MKRGSLFSNKLENLAKVANDEMGFQIKSNASGAFILRGIKIINK